MNDKYVIQVKKTEKWITLDFREGQDLVYVEKFADAYPFDTRNEALTFLSRHDLNKDECDLFKLKLYAHPISWP